MKRILLLLSLLSFAFDGCEPQRTTGSTTLSVNPLVIQVSGNHFIDNSGHTVVLLGANVVIGTSGLGIGCSGPIQQTASAIASWAGINAVRLNLDEDCWLGINGQTGLSQQAVIDYVNQLHQNGIYVILTLNSTAPGSFVSSFNQPMPDSDHSVAFWSSVATAFKNDNAVVFNLFNEPNAVSWSCWLNGGCSVFDAHDNVNYTAIGMQQLVNTVRNAGAVTQPILLDGINFANDLSQFIANMPSDPSHAIAAATHVYNTYNCDTTCMAARVNPVLSAGVPVILGEIGEHDCAHGFIDTIMPWADAYSPPLSYIAWAWQVQDCATFPSLVSDYSGTPTAYGIGFKNHLAAIR